jgi:hypothetical protein
MEIEEEEFFRKLKIDNWRENINSGSIETTDL